MKTKVAVVGAGIAGLAAALELARSGVADVVLYESEGCVGGGALTTVKLDGAGSKEIDLGAAVTMLQLNGVASPNLVEWLAELGAELEQFGATSPFDGLLPAASGRITNALWPSSWGLLQQVRKLEQDIRRFVEQHLDNPDLDRTLTVGQFIQSHGYSQSFRDTFLIPVCSSLWICPPDVILSSSAFSVFSQCRNLGIFQLFNRPQGLRIKDGTSSFVHKVREELESLGCLIKTSCKVQSVLSFEGGCQVVIGEGTEAVYDECIISVRAPDALSIIRGGAAYDELRLLGAFEYFSSDVYLHQDKSFLPPNPSTWNTCNFLGFTEGGVCITYWLNALQNYQSTELPFLVTYNPSSVPNNLLLKWRTGHPVPSVSASKAALEFGQIQGKRRLWFAGAYLGFGFQEDALKAGKAAANGLLGKNCIFLSNPKFMTPSPMEAVARLIVSKFLGHYISIGVLTLIEEGGTVLNFGKADEKCNVKSVLRVHSPLFYWKIATESDIGLADSYICNYFSFVDKREGLLNLLLILIANKETSNNSTASSRKSGWWTPVLLTAGFGSAKYFLRHLSRKNNIAQARRNISQHYDLSNEFFSLFLDATMMYSCAIFKSANEQLEAAQMRKVSLLIEKARVEEHHEVLEIGCGWGTLAVEVVKRTGCRYTGLTLSLEQLKFAKQKAKEAGLEDKIRFLLCDYRQLSKSCKFDRIISCEMIEAVGHEYMDEFFGCCESLLSDYGLFVLQFISIPDERYEGYRRSSDFIKEYIFPGGCLPSLSRITSAMAKASRLCIEHIENIGYHYYQTLRYWNDNFSARKMDILALGFDEQFLRTWEYYFIYCAAGFKSRTLGDYQIVFSRPGNVKAFRDPYSSSPSA